MSLVGYISCWLLFLVLCEGLSGWRQGLGRCWRSGCDSGFNVVLLVRFLYGEGGQTGWGGVYPDGVLVGR